MKKSKFAIVAALLLYLLMSLSSFAATFERRVAAGNDDAEERISDGYMYRDSSDLELVYDGGTGQVVGVRFANITIPPGATITNAYIEFTVDETDSGATNVVIYGEGADDAAQFSSSATDITGRTKTSSSAAWNIPAWNTVGAHGADQRTPNIAPIIQEIVNRGGWSSGNNMAFIIEAGSGCSGSSCQRTAESYNGYSSRAPLLHIEYTTPVAEYRLDECLWDGTSGEVLDSMGSVNGTSYNGAIIDENSSAVLCRSGHFDGSDDYVSMGDSFNSILGGGNNSFTITAWVKPESLSSARSNHRTQNVVIAKASDSHNDNLEIGINTNGRLHLYLDTAGSNGPPGDRADFGNGISAGSWHFIAVSYDGSTVTVNIDGNNHTDNRWSGNLAGASGSPFTLGTTLHSDIFFNGWMDEVKIFDRALTGAQLNTIYNNESAGRTFTGGSRTCSSCVPVNSCSNPYSISVPGTANGHLNRNGDRYDYYRFQAPGDGEIHIYTTGYTGDMDGYLYNDSSNCSGSDIARDNSGNHNIDIRYTISNGTFYKLKLDGWSGDSNYTLHIEFVSNAINSCPGVVIPNLDGASSTVTDNSFHNQNINGLESKYYHFTPAVNGEFRIDFDADNSNRGVTLRVYDGCGNMLFEDTGTGDRVVTQDVLANHQIIAEVYRRYNASMTYDIDFTFTVFTADAVDDNYTTPTNTELTGNLLANDRGPGIHVIDSTQPLHGTVNVQSNGDFTYNPNTNFMGTDTFVYTIADSAGNEDNATVTIDVNTTFTSGSSIPFVLINPQKTRNIIGDYRIAGNTMLCLTERTSGYGGNCQGDNNNYLDITSNMRVSKYLDIDNDSGTWNSTSSFIDFPNTYDPQRGIIWAGLFWQGRISVDKNYNIRYAQENGNTYQLIETGRGTNIGINQFDISTTGATTVKLKIDNGNYEDIMAATFHQYESSNGQTYAAFANVTQLLQDANLNSGKHVFTVANLTTMEGREGSPGAFGGWSLVVIYGENYIQGEPRNISIYNGFISIGTHDSPITISGFKLPSTGDVTAQLSVFSGEGEYRYGRTPNSSSADWMKISDNIASGYDYMPGKPAGTQLGNRDNMFDAVLDNIGRDHVVKNGQNTFNDQSVNNVGVDVDTYDVSQLMESYRNANKDIHDIYIKTYSNNDYITPSMIAFSAQLYKPSVCYDYVVKRNGFIIPSDNFTYETRIRENDEISFTVAVWDISGDIVLRYVTVALPITQIEGHIQSLTHKAYYSQKNSNAMLLTDLAAMSNSSRPVIAIGDGRTADVGGTVDHDERYFTKFFFEANNPNQTRIRGTFNIEVNATMNFGSGDFWQILDAERCPQNPVYNPTWYRFNIERNFGSSVPSNPTAHYSLPTRIAARDFNYDVAAYTQDTHGDYTVASQANGVTVDVELVDIGAFDDNKSFFKCGNPEPSIIMMPGRFNYFDHNDTRIPVTDANDLKSTYAVRNATFRMWLLIDENGTIITSSSRVLKNDNGYFSSVYNNYFRAQDPRNLCTNACTSPYNYNSPRLPYDPSATGCYACLRDYFAQPYCARDNFAIRPRAIKVELNDKGKDANLTAIKIAENQSMAGVTPDNVVDIAAGYPYRMTLIAKDDDGNKTKGYYSSWFFEQQDVNSSSMQDGSAAMLKFDDDSSCADKSDNSYEAVFYNGEAVDESLQHDNAGKYIFEIWDNEWSKVDQAYDNPNKTVFENGCSNSTNANCNDCTIRNATDEEESGTEKVGCLLGSYLISRSGNDSNEYTKLDLTFHPYTFDMSSMSLHTNPTDGKEWVYMNDLSKNTDAAITLEGNITAIGADGGTLSNYTATCAANDLELRIAFQTKPDPVVDQDGNSVEFQQIMADIFGNGPVKKADENVTLAKGNFTNTADVNGSAAVKIYYNFKKSYDKVINIADVNFSEMKAYGVNDLTYVDQLSDHMPEGNTTINDTKYFYFAKVGPQTGTDGHVEYGTSFDSTFWVDVYCKDTADVDCNSSLPGLYTANPDFVTATGNWFRVSGHTGSTDGNMVSLLSTSINSNDPVGINPNLNIQFDSNGSTGAVTFSYPATSYRPQEAVITIIPDEWLKYDYRTANNGKPEFKIYFRNQGLLWKGEGKTGHVIESEPAPGNQLQRVNW